MVLDDNRTMATQRAANRQCDILRRGGRPKDRHYRRTQCGRWPGSVRVGPGCALRVRDLGSRRQMTPLRESTGNAFLFSQFGQTCPIADPVEYEQADR